MVREAALLPGQDTHVLGGGETAMYGYNTPLRLRDIAALMSVVTVFVNYTVSVEKLAKVQQQQKQ